MLTVITVAALAVALSCLGFWQLARAEEKKQLLERIESRSRQAPMRLDPIMADTEDLKYRRVEFNGKFDPHHQFLLDNRIQGGKTGVFVFTPFRLSGSGVTLLVNRGWVPWDSRRRIISDLSVPDRPLHLRGRVNDFPGVGYRLKGAEIPTSEWPALVQVVDVDTLSGVLGYPLQPYQVMLDPAENHGFAREWKLTFPVSPEKHLAYAVQWFALAGVLLILFCYRWLRQDEQS